MPLALQPLGNLLKKGKTLSKNIFQLKMCFDLRSFSKMKDLFIALFYFQGRKTKILSGYGVNGSMRSFHHSEHFISMSASGLSHLFWEQVLKGNRVFESRHADDFSSIPFSQT